MPTDPPASGPRPIRVLKLGDQQPGQTCTFTCESVPSPRGEIVVVRVNGDVRPSIHAALRSILLGALDRKPCHLVVELGEMDFCDRGGFALLAAVSDVASGYGVGFCVSGLPPRLRLVASRSWLHNRPALFRCAALAVMTIRTNQLAL